MTRDDLPTELQQGCRFLNEAAALLDRPERTVVEVTGDRVADLVAGLVTNDVQSLAIDRALYSFMLTPKGRPVAEMRVLRRSAGLWLDMPDSCLSPALEHLGKYLPPRLARFRTAESWGQLSVVGPLADRALGALDFIPGAGDLDRLQAAHVEQPPLATLVRREAIEGPGFDLYTTEPEAWRETLENAVESVGGGRVGPDAYDAWRIERGIPIYGREIDLDVLPQETGQEKRAISFTKGCYTGQEVVARIHYRGHVNRYLRTLRFAQDAGGIDGTELFDGDRPAGRVTSVARHPVHGDIGLGYIRREVEPGSKIAVRKGGRCSCTVLSLGALRSET